MLPRLSSSPQVDEKCVSCGHKGLSFYTMQVRMRACGSSQSSVRDCLFTPGCESSLLCASTSCSSDPLMRARRCSLSALSASERAHRRVCALPEQCTGGFCLQEG